MSCNGCRVLRKGCSESCLLRPCLAAVEGADAQGHATLFLAKFFGRAGLMGFISAVDETQRPALFQSLLYEACGRSINPVYGSAGLLWTGQWHLCEAAVESVLKGGTPTSCFTNVHTPSSMTSNTSSLRQCNPGFMQTPTGLPPQPQLPPSIASRAQTVANPMASFPFPLMDPSNMSYWPAMPMGSMPNSMSHVSPMMGPGGYKSIYQPSSCPLPVPGHNYLTTSNRMECGPIPGSNSSSASNQMWTHEAAMAHAPHSVPVGYHSKPYQHEMANSNSPVSDVSCVVDNTMSGMHCSSPPLVTPVARRLTVQADKAGDSASFGLASPSFVSSSNGYYGRPYGQDGGLTWQSA